MIKWRREWWREKTEKEKKEKPKQKATGEGGREGKKRIGKLGTW